MRKKILVAMGLFYALSFYGCVTAPRKDDLELQALKNQIVVLETQLQAKEQEILELQDDVARAGEEKARFAQKSFQSASRSPIVPSVKEIQTALKNAGFNPGIIDGKMGSKTRNAIRSFQKANHLAVNGKVGKKTWQALKSYLE